MSELAQRLANLSPAQRQLLEKRLAQPKPTAEPIAVVGMSCRFAGARSLADYWRVISEGIEATREVPPDRWDIDELYDATGTQNGKMSTRWGGFVDDIDQFDPAFFGIAPREAARMDPQQRLLLEVAWETLENAGLPADKMAGTQTAVFVGIGGTDYSKVPAQFADYFCHIDAHVGTGNALSIASNRISYIFDFHGPSASVDTACSSSSLAIHLAVDSLRRGEATAALAGGVNAIITPETTIAFSKARMLSPEGKCRPFDSRANGYVRGEGCGLVLLKKLSDAQKDGDNILGVILATSVNQDGRTSGISAPNGQSQKLCIRAALSQAGLSPGDISYIEAHGTGTPLGDPIEMQALSEVFVRSGDSQLPLVVSSVKANIGHTETVSGVAGLIKTLLLMQHNTFVPQLHFEQLNPHISLAGSRIEIPTAKRPWTAPARRLAGISSFGFGGTNTHLIVEAPPAAPAAATGDAAIRVASQSNGRTAAAEGAAPWNVLKIAGRGTSAIARQAAQYAEVLKSHPEWPVADVCFTANTSRCDFNHRAAVVGNSRESLVEQLELLAAGKRGPAIRQGSVKGMARSQVALLFTGQGSQYVGMGRELYDTQPVFRAALDECATALSPWMDLPLLTLLFPGPGDDASRIDNTVYTQPCLVSLEYATARLWQHWGLVPHYLIGHSVGEYAAAIIGGAVSLVDGLSLIARRGQLMQRVTAAGKMAVVFASEAQVAAAIADYEGQVSVATINGPANTVISGDADAVDLLVKQFAEQGLSVQPLNVSHAFHSHHMDCVLDEFAKFANGLEFHEPSIPIISNVTGQPYEGAPDAQYWCDHLRGAVRFSDGVATLAEAGTNIMVEVGPAASLVGMAKRCHTGSDVALIGTMRKGTSAAQSAALACAEFYAAGGQFDWHKLAPTDQPRRVPLPNYPFERARYWLEPGDAGGSSRVARKTSQGPPLLGDRVPSVWSSAVYETVIDAQQPPFLQDHVVQGSVVVPAAAFIDQALAAARATFGAGSHVVENLSVQQAMFLPTGSPRLMQVAVAAESSGETTIESYSAVADGPLDSASWTMHAAALLKHADKAALPELPAIDLDAFRERIVDTKSRDEFYQLIANRGLVYGPQFQVLGRVERSPSEAFAPLEPHPHVVAELAKHELHPVLGDACMQTLASTVPLEEDGSYSPFTYMPVGVRQVRVLRPVVDMQAPLFCYAVRRAGGEGPSPEMVESDVVVVDAAGNILVALLGARVQRIGRGKQTAVADPTSWLYKIEWRETELAGGSTPAAGRTLLFADSTGVADQLAPQLAAQGEVVRVVPGTSYRFDSQARTATIDPLDADHYKRLLGDCCGDAQAAAIVHLWSLDVPPIDQPDAWGEARRLSVGSVLQFTKQLVRHGWRKSPRCWFVTRGAQPSGGTPAVAQAPLVGLVRVAQMEHPEHRPTLVDFATTLSSGDVAALLARELAAGASDQQILWDAGQRFVATLAAASDSIAAAPQHAGQMSIPDDTAFQLRFHAAGSFDALRYVPVDRKPLAPNEVEIEVHATGLNFSDVLKALGLYPGIKDEIVPLGIETSGVVTAVGSDVDRFAVGQQVMGVAPYAFGSHTVTPEYTLVAKPASLSHIEAAAVPIAYLTAYHALVKLADLQPGERLLIHAAAGGVGVAAIDIAQQIGAEIYATAGSEEKHAYLRELGVEHIYSSRSLDFYDQILADTHRDGVDVVLNSLPGEAITKSLKLLRAYGRFLEIGKIDIYQNRMLGLLPFQDNLSYFAIDLDRVLRQRHDYIRRLFAELMQHFEQGDYSAPRSTVFGVEQTIDAFRYMSARKNIGKIVVDMQSHGRRQRESTDEQPLVRGDGSYLITGGLGALGLRVAQWLASLGAGALVLVSRRGEPAEGETALAIAKLREGGTLVHCLAADVVERDQLDKGLAQLPRELPPLRGVVHAAGVLADGVLADMSLAALDKALLPKTVGACNLHEATLDAPLDFFIMFSSVAAILGSPGQANYAAANAALDTLAHYRRSQNLPATSINWGPWADSGMAAEQGRGEGIQARGMDLLPADASLRLMRQIVESGATQLTVMDVHWDSLLRLLGNRRPRLLDAVAAAEANGQQAIETASKVDRQFRQQLDQAAADDRVPMLRDYIQNELARIMSFEPDQLDVSQPLAAFGLDSLMALELKNNLEARLDFTLPMAKLLEGPSIASLASDVAELLDSSTSRASTDSGTEWTPLVELKRGDNTLPPLVLFPALGGDVRYYGPFVHHLQSQNPVLAFRPRGIDDNNPPHSDIAELTRDYVAALKQRWPSGPYCLAGWSAGGVTAFVVAEALRQAGDNVALLALFDTALPTIYRNVDPDDDSRFLCDLVTFTNRFAGTKIDVSYEQLQKLPADQRFASALRQAREQGMFPPEVSDDYVHRLVSAGEGMVRANLQYTPRAIDIPMHLFQPEIEGGLFDISGHEQPEDLGWGSEVGQELIRARVAGDHFTMMLDKGAQQLAKAIDQVLAKRP
jgi:acyl transferase domain-containing protein/thioesterase domain-containing protein/acyl carrier protein